MKAHLAENNKYWLEQLHGYGSEMLDEEMQHIIYDQAPVFVKIKCFCGNEFFFCDEKIPAGEKYEVGCPYCHASLLRKKEMLRMDNLQTFLQMVQNSNNIVFFLKKP